jgi:hypothetical protein
MRGLQSVGHIPDESVIGFELRFRLEDGKSSRIPLEPSG